MWRMRWLLRELFDTSTGPALRTELEMPALYKLSLLLKVFHWMPGSIVYS